MRRIILILVFIVGATIFLKHEIETQNVINKVCLEDLNLQLIGILDAIDKPENYHGYGIIRLKVISSNISEYDPRAKQEFYFCIIKNGIAEMYDHVPNSSYGDTIIYNTKLKLVSYVRNNKREEEGSISVNANEAYYDYIKSKTIFLP